MKNFRMTIVGLIAYQYKHWTDFTWQNAAISGLFGEVRLLQGKPLGQIQSLGFSSKEGKMR